MADFPPQFFPWGFKLRESGEGGKRERGRGRKGGITYAGDISPGKHPAWEIHQLVVRIIS